MDHHEQALYFVKQFCIGRTCEIVWKKKWGFWKEGELEAGFYDVNEFLRLECLYDTICLHILSGSMEKFKGDTSRIKEAIKKAERSCRRLLILEHNPDFQDFKDNKDLLAYRLEQIKSEVNSLGKPYTELNWGRYCMFSIETRETLLDSVGIYVSDSIDSRFNRTYPSGPTQSKGLDRQGNVFVRSNELTPKNEIIEAIERCSAESKFISLIKGFAFLDLISHIGSRKIILVDHHLKQCLFCKFVLELISKNETPNDFFSSTTDIASLKEFCYLKFDQKILRALDQFISIDNLCEYFIEAKEDNDEWVGRMSNRPWINSYEDSRRKIMYNIESIMCGDIVDVCRANPNNISYISSTPIHRIKSIVNYSDNIIWTGNWPKCKNEPFFLKKQVDSAQG